jgi:hypothetical protein
MIDDPNIEHELSKASIYGQINLTDMPPESINLETKKFNQQEGRLIIPLTLVITVSSTFGITLILLTIAIAFDRIPFSEAEHMFNLILVALVALTGTALGFYFRNHS